MRLFYKLHTLFFFFLCLSLALNLLSARRTIELRQDDEAGRLRVIIDGQNGSAQMAILENGEKGTLTVRDGQVDVLTYRFGDQLKKGLDPGQTRSCYIHPLYSLDGQVLTEDFPQDHFHHHGIFWTWPIVKTRGQNTQTWHPANLRQHFVRWLKREVKDGVAKLRIENAWKLDGKEVVAKEIVTMQIHQADELGRAIDLELTLEAVGGPLTLQGSQDQNKGYGGFSLRSAPMFKGTTMATGQGLEEKDSNNKRFRWVGLSTAQAGVAVFVSPDHPDFPPTWCIRNSYAGFLNVSWPGLKPFVLQPGQPVTLRYRMYIHRGDMTASHIQEAYEIYRSEKRRNHPALHP